MASRSSQGPGHDSVLQCAVMADIQRSRTVPSFSVASSPSESSIQPRRPSLEPEREIFSTRGQSLATLIRRRSFSQGLFDSSQEDDQYRDEPAPQERLDRSQLERAMRLIGDSRPIYHWPRYYRDPSTLKKMENGLRKYYERNNDLIARYVYIDRLLDSPLPHRLIGDYHQNLYDIPEAEYEGGQNGHPRQGSYDSIGENNTTPRPPDKIKRTPQNIFRFPTDTTPLLTPLADESAPIAPDALHEGSEFVDSGARIVEIAIYVNFIANVILLAAKIAVMTMTNSLSVLASLVDGALDFLSTAIVWVTSTLIKRQDRSRFPISRRRLEPLSILIFAVVMMTSFVQVAITSLGRLLSDDHAVVELSTPSIAVMASTVLVKLACWFWCRLVRNSSVQALAQDAMTDVIFNLFSILFPLIGAFTKTWFVDPLGGLVLSLYIIWNWGGTASEHIGHLTGTAASNIDHSVLLYMTMRFSKSILKIQDLKAYYAGDLLNVEVDIVLEGQTNLRDSHDIGESLQYVIESVPTVDRAFVHLDYDPWNIPSHMNQQES